MDAEASLNQELVRNLTIPPRPDVVALLFEEMSRDEPDFARISRHIAADVGLAAAMLKAANSPAFGLPRKVSSIQHAIEFLGIRQVSGIATGLVIRHTLSGKGGDHQHFWVAAEKCAQICARTARSLRGIPVDEAYTFGLFHDCGIPLLSRHFPRYDDTLAKAQQGDGASFTLTEEGDVGTHHGAVGYFLARSWQLPNHFCRAILWHHDIEVFADQDIADPVRNLIGLVHLAEHILGLVMFDTPTAEWARFETPVMRHFGLSDEDFINLVDDAAEAIGGE